MALVVEFVGGPEGLESELVSIWRLALVDGPVDLVHGPVCQPHVAAALVGSFLARVSHELVPLLSGHAHRTKANQWPTRVRDRDHPASPVGRGGARRGGGRLRGRRGARRPGGPAARLRRRRSPHLYFSP